MKSAAVRGVLGLAILAGCVPVEGEPEALEVAGAAIINGTREPQQTILSAGQKMALGYVHDAGQPWSYFCSGTLIAPDVVLTARHCTKAASEMGFGVGVVPGDSVPWFQVAQVHDHPQSDVALLILTEPVTRRLPQVQPLGYGRQSLGQADAGRRIEVCGYGDTYDFSKEGRWCGVSEIVGIDGDAIVVNGGGEQGICFGDSGGGALMAGGDGQVRVVAVVSGGESDYCLGYNEWLVQTGDVRGWIEQLLGDRPDPGGQDPGGSGNVNPTDSCQGIDAMGICEGGARWWCDGGSLRQEICVSRGLTCVDDSRGARCQDSSGRTPEPEPEPQSPGGAPDPEGGDDVQPGGQSPPAPDPGDQGGGSGWADEGGAGWVGDEGAGAAPLAGQAMCQSAPAGQRPINIWMWAALLGAIALWRGFEVRLRRLQP